MDRVFPGATGFIQAVSVNPLEIGRYFFLNAAHNLVNSYHLLSTHSMILPMKLNVAGWPGPPGSKALQFVLWAEQIVLCLGIAGGSIWLAARKFSVYKREKTWKSESLFIITGLASVSIPAVLLLIADARYWISAIPLLFWGPAAFISRKTERMRSRTTVCLAVILTILAHNPVFTSPYNLAAHSNRDLVMALRAKLPPSSEAPVKALGAWPDPMLAFAVPGRGHSTSSFDVRKGSSFEALVKGGDHDLVIIDTWLKEGQQYQKELAFFESFSDHPEKYGYRPLLVTERRDGPVAVFVRSDS